MFDLMIIVIKLGFTWFCPLMPYFGSQSVDAVQFSKGCNSVMFTFWSFNLYYLYIIFTYITFTYGSWKSIESLWLSQHSHWSQAIYLLASLEDLEQFWHCGSCALAVLLMLTLPSLPRTSCPSSLGFGCIYTPSAMVTWQGVFLSVNVCFPNLEVSSSNSFLKDGSFVEKYWFDFLLVLENSGSSG